MIGELFGKAWELYKRNVSWLILAGFVVARVRRRDLRPRHEHPVGSIVTAVDIDVIGDVVRLRWTPLERRRGLFRAAIAVYVVGATLAVRCSALVFTAASRDGRRGRTRRADAHIGDLFSGFRRLGSYVAPRLCQVGMLSRIELIVFASFRYLGALGLLVGLAGFCAAVWIVVSWIYSIVLVTDRSMGGVEALRGEHAHGEERRMVAHLRRAAGASSSAFRDRPGHRPSSPPPQGWSARTRRCSAISLHRLRGARRPVQPSATSRRCTSGRARLR